MATVEQEIPVGDKRTLIERFIEAIKRLFKRKSEEEAIKKIAKEAEKKRREAEKPGERERERKRKEAEEKTRDYLKRASGEEVLELEAAKEKRIGEIQGKLQEFIANRGKEGSGYLFEALQADTNYQNQLKTLIEESIQQDTAAAEIINELVTRGRELHGNAPELISLGRMLLFEAERVGMAEAAKPVLQAVTARATAITEEELRVRTDEHGRRYDAPVWLEMQLKPITTLEERNKLRDENQWQQAVNEIINTSRTSQEATWVDQAKTTSFTQEGTSGSFPPPKDLANEVGRIWAEVGAREKSGAPLSVEELEAKRKELLAAESQYYPSDVLPGTEAYRKVVVASHNLIEEKLKLLVEEWEKRIKKEQPPVPEGITDPQRFIEAWIQHPGYFGQLLGRNPEIRKLFLADTPEGMSFRSQVFLTIHSQILTQRRESSHENFGLYERADFTSFISLLRSSLLRKRPETGKTFGQSWAEWYTGLSNTIRHSRDIDFWASQPGAKIDDFNKSIALFQNEYSTQALSIPAVEQAFRAYETVLRSIQASNDGYIPPALIEYDAVNQRSFWDDRAQDMLQNMIAQGVVHDMKRDKRYGFFPVVSPDGHTVELGDLLKKEDVLDKDPQRLELAMYMTLAKGFGMVSARLLEIFANSKVPGSDHPVYAMDQFHSLPYEGVAMAMNYFSMMVHKWKFGSYRYFHLMNQILPEGKKLNFDPRDCKDFADIYLSYRAGADTFKEKYGEDAKRVIDLTNFSRCSSAFGPPYTSWRHMDTTIGWSDKQRELMGGSARIMLAKEKFAPEKVKDFLLAGPYKEAFRKVMAAKGLPTAGPEFAKRWQDQGKPMYKREMDEKWDKIKEKKEVEEMIEDYTKAYKARVWVEIAMRNPLAIGHNVTIEVPNEGFEDDPDPKKRKKTIKLHDYLVEQVLEIPRRDRFYGAAPGSDGLVIKATPTQEQFNYMLETLNLEGDLAAVKERAINGKPEAKDMGNRELKDEDFDEVIKDPVRCEQAKDYWKMCQRIMLGDLSHEQWYKEVGLPLVEGSENYQIDWDKVEKINKTLEHISTHTTGLSDINKGKIILDEKWVEKEWEWMFGTDDTAYRQMDILNLGARHWVRRGGDIAAHYNGGQAFADYMTNALGPNPDPKALAEALKKIRQAYEGDMIEAGWHTVRMLSYLTTKLYSMDWTRLGSPAQLDVWMTRRNVAAWLANARRKFIDELEHQDVLPPRHETFMKYYNIEELDNLHNLRRQIHADNIDVWAEIIALGFLLAIAITIYRAFKAKSEEEEGGGGGHH